MESARNSRTLQLYFEASLGYRRHLFQIQNQGQGDDSAVVCLEFTSEGLWARFNDRVHA